MCEKYQKQKSKKINFEIEIFSNIYNSYNHPTLIGLVNLNN